MSARTLKGSSGRTWICTPAAVNEADSKSGRDVSLSCTTESVAAPVDVTVGWQWASMSDNGLARLIAAKAVVKH